MAQGESEKTEKITINLGLVDLGQIDLLVQEGFYTNRTDFIRTAIRTQLAARGEALDQSAARRTLTLGSCHYTRRDLEEIRDAGQMIHIRVLGLASIAADVSPQLALATIASVEVLGAFRAPTAPSSAPPLTGGCRWGGSRRAGCAAPALSAAGAPRVPSSHRGPRRRPPSGSRAGSTPSPIPTPPVPAPTGSMSQPATPAPPCPWPRCSPAAPRLQPPSPRR